MDKRVTELQHVLEKMEMVDLSHTLEPNIPSWPTHAKFFHNLVASYEFGDEACHYQLVMSEHSGTHVDSPLHFISAGKAHYGIEQIPLSTFSGRAATISATDVGKKGLLRVSHVQDWEAENGNIEEDDIVLIHFGWDRFWNTRPHANDFLTDWPGLSLEAAEYFVQKKVKMVGTDVLALDVYGTTEHPAHHTLLGNEILIMENLNHLDRLPPFSYFMGFPLKIKNGSGSPIRAVAYIPK